MFTFWLMYGLMTGIIIVLACYLLLSRTSAFAAGAFQPAMRIRRWAGVNILVVGLEYLTVLAYIDRFTFLFDGGTMTYSMEYALMCQE